MDIISLLTVGTDILKSVIEWRKEIALKFGDVVTREKVYLINSEYVTYKIHCLAIKKSGVGGADGSEGELKIEGTDKHFNPMAR